MAIIYSTHEVGEQIGIEIRSGQQLDGEIVWMRDGCIGVQFANEIDVDDMLKVMSADRKRLRARAPRLEVYGRANSKVGNRVIRVALDRKSGVEGKSVSVRVDLGGRRSVKQKSNTRQY